MEVVKITATIIVIVNSRTRLAGSFFNIIFKYRFLHMPILCTINRLRKLMQCSHREVYALFGLKRNAIL